MTSYRDNLPQLNGQLMTTGGGMETSLQYKSGYELPHFCLFHLLNDEGATQALREFHREIAQVSIENGFGPIMEGLHYRASSDWGKLLGYSKEGLEEINLRGIEFYREIAAEFSESGYPMPIGGVVGPRGDAYNVGQKPEANASEDYHSEQVETFDKAGVDMISGITFSFVEEAIGLVRAVKARNIPAVISFTVNKDTRLATGETMREAVDKVDEATDGGPAYYMINCAHPIDFEPALEPGDWLGRINGFMPNAASLDKGTLCSLGNLEEGDPVELGGQMADVARRLPHATVWGGCCGTDQKHINEICKSVGAIRADAAA